MERALIYLGATDEQVQEHRAIMQQTGQGTSHIRLLPGRKNLLRIDRSKLIPREALEAEQPRCSTDEQVQEIRTYLINAAVVSPLAALGVDSCLLPTSPFTRLALGSDKANVDVTMLRDRILEPRLIVVSRCLKLPIKRLREILPMKVGAVAFSSSFFPKKPRTTRLGIPRLPISAGNSGTHFQSKALTAPYKKRKG